MKNDAQMEAHDSIGAGILHISIKRFTSLPLSSVDALFQ